MSATGLTTWAAFSWILLAVVMALVGFFATAFGGFVLLLPAIPVAALGLALGACPSSRIVLWLAAVVGSGLLIVAVLWLVASAAPIVLVLGVIAAVAAGLSILALRRFRST